MLYRANFLKNGRLQGYSAVKWTAALILIVQVLRNEDKFDQKARILLGTIVKKKTHNYIYIYTHEVLIAEGKT